VLASLERRRWKIRIAGAPGLSATKDYHTVVRFIPKILRKAEVMAVPKRRTSHARQGKRRSHLHVKPIQIQYCNRCEQPVLPHHVCPNCGYYQNREVVPAEEEK
jgi:large subunit ribosomal protein L32